MDLQGKKTWKGRKKEWERNGKLIYTERKHGKGRKKGMGNGFPGNLLCLLTYVIRKGGKREGKWISRRKVSLFGTPRGASQRMQAKWKKSSEKSYYSFFLVI